MQILSLNCLSKINFKGSIKTSDNICCPKSLEQDTFSPSYSLKRQKQLCEILKNISYDSLNSEDEVMKECFPVLTSCDEFGEKDYKKMSEFEKKCARIIANKEIALVEQVKYATKFAKALKEYFDDKYGKANYSFLGIGRSPSGVAKIMQLEGAKSDSVPFSRMSIINAPKEVFEKFNWKKHFAKFGFDKEILMDKSKITIASDYVYSGATLELFSDIMKKTYPDSNVQFVDIVDLVNNIPDKYTNKYELTKDNKRNLILALEDCDYKLSLCTCPHYWKMSDYNTSEKQPIKLQTQISLFDYFDQKKC